jgi:F-type H+-transporting ATPase subunit beta
LAQYEALKDIVAMLGLEQLSPEDRNAVARARRLERFLTQPFFTTEQFSGIKGKLVSLKDSLDGCERILRDEFKDYPESALYMIGAIGEAKKTGFENETEKRDENRAESRREIRTENRSENGTKDRTENRTENRNENRNENRASEGP